MSKVKSNFIYSAMYQVLVLIIPFITTPYVARTIGAKSVGIYAYTYSIVNYFMMFALLGMNNYGKREISKAKDDKDKLSKTFSSIYYLQVVNTLIIMILYIGYILLFDSKYLKIEMIQFLYLISIAVDINWFFAGLQKFKLTVIRNGIIKIITLILIFVFVKTSNDLIKYIVILAVTTVLSQLALWPTLRKEAKFVKVKIKDIIKHLKPTLILFVPVLALSIFRVMDKIMVGKISTVTEVGYYENAEKMLNIILSVIGALGTVTLPEMTYLYANKRYEEFNKILKKSITVILFLVFPVIFGFILTADSLVVIYLGKGFTRSSNLLKVLSISLLFSPIASIIRMQLLVPQNRDKEYIICVSIGAIINLIANFILIPRLGALGASIATILAEGMVAIVEIIFVKTNLNILEYKNEILRFLFSSIIMFITAYLVGLLSSRTVIKLVLQVGTGMTVYFLLNISYIKSEIDFKKFLRKKKKNE